MCGGSPPQDNSAAIARQQEQERQKRIDEGKSKIDSAFSVFDPAYYDKFKQDYLNYYNPQVDKQFTDSRKDLRYNLVRAGIDDGTPGQKAFGDLTKAYGDRRTELASNALEATNKVKSQVESNKNDLYAQNTASADPSLSAIQALSSAGSLQSPPAFSPLSSLFSGLVNAGAAYTYGQNRALPAGYSQAFSSGAPIGGSSRVVG